MRYEPFVFSFLIFLFACVDDPSTSSMVIQLEEPIYISGERVVLSARLHFQPQDILDHGFQISSHQDIISPIIISLGKGAEQGLILGETKELKIGEKYYYQAFIKYSSKDSIASEIKTFETLLPQVIMSVPKSALPGSSIEIIGANFTKDTKVFFGERSALVDSIIDESILVVKVPPIGNQSSEMISILCQDTTMTISDFEYEIGKWEMVGTANNNINIAFPAIVESEQSVVFGFGIRIGAESYNQNFWKIDKQTFEYSSFPSPSGALPVESPFNFTGGFSAGRYDKGLGLNLVTSDTWILENDLWFEGDDFPVLLFQGVRISIDANEYIIGGRTENLRNSEDLYVKQAGSSNWQKVEGFTSKKVLSTSPHFTYKGQFYFMNDLQELWTLDPITLEWSNVTEFLVDLGVDPFAERVGNLVFIGLGAGSSSMVQYDIEQDQISRKTAFPGAISDLNTVSWVNNGMVFVIRAKANSEGPMEIWKLSPDEF